MDTNKILENPKWGVHITHCCVKHGCKYGDDDCPVVLKQADARYSCEYCNEDEIEKEYNKEYRESIAKEIILALDIYGRNINKKEYGLPIDPDFHSWDHKRAKEMLDLVMNII